MALPESALAKEQQLEDMIVAAPRTARAAMRHSSIDLTMNVYTDPKLLDVHGALNSLPSLDFPAERDSMHLTLRATGTEELRRSFVAPDVAPAAYKAGHLESFPVKTTEIGEQRSSKPSDHAKPVKSNKKALPAGFADKAFRSGAEGS